MRDTDLFQPFEKLIEIRLLGKPFSVPENNTIMRCLQYLELGSVSYGDFCWNGECMNCQVWVENGDKEKPLLACRANAIEGMHVVRVCEIMKPAIESVMNAST